MEFFLIFILTSPELPLPILAEPTDVVELFSAPVLVLPLPAGA